MRITDLTLTLFSWDDIPTATYGSFILPNPTRSELGLLELQTDAGVVGHSFLGSSGRSARLDAETLLTYLKPIVVGQDPMDREKIHQGLMGRHRQTTLRTIGAVDVALWDLAGKAVGLPIHKLLGSYRDSVPAYASSVMLPSKEAYAEEALRYKAAGWAAYKIHAPTDPRLDIEVCEAVRKAVGDDYILMLDSTWSYQYPDAVRVGKAIEELGFYWYEDPLVEDDIYNYVKLKQQLSIPILATEHPPYGLTGYVPWLVSKTTDYLRGDVSIKGGISTIVKGAHLAEAFHMGFEVHHGGNSLNNVANLHVIMAIKNCEFFEVLLPDETQKYGLVRDIEVDEQGIVHAFNEPGLGAQIDFELIERKKVQVLR